jgi:hypothetical protein
VFYPGKTPVNRFFDNLLPDVTRLRLEPSVNNLASTEVADSLTCRLPVNAKPNRILHVDGDSFFASCEIALDSSLESRPVWAGGEDVCDAKWIAISFALLKILQLSNRPWCLVKPIGEHVPLVPKASRTRFNPEYVRWEKW